MRPRRITADRGPSSWPFRKRRGRDPAALKERQLKKRIGASLRDYRVWMTRLRGDVRQIFWKTQGSVGSGFDPRFVDRSDGQNTGRRPAGRAGKT